MKGRREKEGKCKRKGMKRERKRENGEVNGSFKGKIGKRKNKG
jgi:hypothetical protein